MPFNFRYREKMEFEHHVHFELCSIIAAPPNLFGSAVLCPKPGLRLYSVGWCRFVAAVPGGRPCNDLAAS